MKMILVMISLILLATICQAQDERSMYSQQNLDRASVEELNFYLARAEKQKKIGGIELIIAPVAGALGLLLWSEASKTGGSPTPGVGLMIGSLTTFAIGIPTRLIGSSRVKKVTKALNAKSGTSTIKLINGSSFNYQTRSIQPGITLSIGI